MGVVIAQRQSDEAVRASDLIAYGYSMLSMTVAVMGAAVLRANSSPRQPVVIARAPGIAVVDKPHGAQLAECQPALPEGGAFVHNLDRVTSGCLVGATTREAASALGRLWQAKRVVKVYLALVEGHCAWDHHRHRSDARIATSRRRSKQRVSATGKRSQTLASVACVGELDGSPVTLVWCWPVTGRRHQLRVHLSHAGHPICGDTKYAADTSGAPLVERVCLHCCFVALPLPPEAGGTLMATSRLDATRWPRLAASQLPDQQRFGELLRPAPADWFGGLGDPTIADDDGASIATALAETAVDPTLLKPPVTN